jgi:hypothetical protein
MACMKICIRLLASWTKMKPCFMTFCYVIFYPLTSCYNLTIYHCLFCAIELCIFWSAYDWFINRNWNDWFLFEWINFSWSFSKLKSKLYFFIMELLYFLLFQKLNQYYDSRLNKLHFYTKNNWDLLYFVNVSIYQNIKKMPWIMHTIAVWKMAYFQEHAF